MKEVNIFDMPDTNHFITQPKEVDIMQQPAGEINIFDMPNLPPVVETEGALKKITQFGKDVFYSFLDKPASTIGKLILDPLMWTGARMSYTLATPATALVQARLSLPQQLLRPPEKPLEELKHLKEVPGAILTGLKGWLPGQDIPETAKTWEQFWKTYYGTIAGKYLGHEEEGPDITAKLAAAGTEFLVTPIPFSQGLKAVTPLVRAAKLKMGIESLAPLESMKIEALAEKGVGLGRAEHMAKHLAEKELQKLADEVTESLRKSLPKSMKAGFKLTPKAISHRLYQLSGGRGVAGITTQTALQAKSNAIVADLQAGEESLRKLGTLDTATYNTMLTNKEVTAEWTKINELRLKRTKLFEVSAKKGLLKAAENKQSKPYIEKLWGLKREVRAGGTYIEGVKGTKEATRLVDKVERLAYRLDTASKTDQERIINKIVGLTRKFPGQSKLAKGIDAEIQDSLWRLWVNETYGGAPYLPRMYIPKEVPLAERIKTSVYRALKIRAPYAKERELYLLTHPEARKALQEITHVEYPVVKRLLQEATDISNAKLFNLIAEQPGWVKDIPLLAYPQRIPEGTAYGALANKYVIPQVYHTVMDLTTAPTEIGKWFDRSMGLYKMGKVALSPSVQIHNLGGNWVLAAASGVDETARWKLGQLVRSEKMANTDAWQWFHKHISPTFYFKNEYIDDILGTFAEQTKPIVKQTFAKEIKSGIGKFLAGVVRSYEKVGKVPSQWYTHNEMINKAIIYYDRLNKGMNRMEAFKDAQKWGINYSDLAQWEKSIARRIIPFYTFPRKAIPLVLEGFRDRPYALAKYALIPKLATQWSLHRLKITDNDWKTIQDDLPEYVKHNNWMLMPYRDKNGDLRLLDWTPFLPWQQLIESQDEGILKSLSMNPLIQIWSDIGQNRASLTGKEIWLETDTSEEKFRKKLAYFWGLTAPTIATNKYFWDRIYYAISGKKQVVGRKEKYVPFPETLVQTMLGLRTIAVDTELNHRFKVIDKQMKTKEMRKKYRDLAIGHSNGSISDVEFQNLSEQYDEQMEEINE